MRILRTLPASRAGREGGTCGASRPVMPLAGSPAIVPLWALFAATVAGCTGLVTSAATDGGTRDEVDAGPGGSSTAPSGSPSVPPDGVIDPGISGTMDAAAAITGVDGSAEVVGGICGGDDASSSQTSDPAACPCTRRPGPGDSFLCPAGVGEFVSEAIGPEGGTIAIQGRQFPRSGVAATLSFPPTALPQSTNIVLTETAIPPPADFSDWSPVYRVEPLGLRLAAATPVLFPWSNVSGAVPQNLAIWFSPDGACFSPLPDSYLNAGANNGSTRQLGYFIVGVPRSPNSSCP